MVHGFFVKTKSSFFVCRKICLHNIENADTKTGFYGTFDNFRVVKR